MTRAVREGAPPLTLSQLVMTLHGVPQIGEKALLRVLRRMAQSRVTPDEFLAMPAEQWRHGYGLHAAAVAFLDARRGTLAAEVEALGRAARSQQLHVLTVASAVYPARLDRYEDDPPPVLYAVGSLRLLTSVDANAPTFTVAASNGASSAALGMLDEAAERLVAAGCVPVTGHDRPAYQRLGLAAQRVGRPALYVLDRGLREALGENFDRPLFAAARIHEASLDTGRDLVVSPFRLDDHALGAHNRRRDRLIFALADLIMVVDARSGGVMVAECLRAHRQGRPVYVAAGGRDGNEELRAAGCSALPTGADWPRDVLTSLRRRPADG